ncbi:MAG TPA: Fis family transcriptional regulator [Candidatus Atribacteria bacterium]|nr:Fis family transcriptional regulator [Candidatus Atribacteria bacterium]
MRCFLVITKSKKVFKKIQGCFLQGYLVEKAPTQKAGLEFLRKKRYDFIFIDLNQLLESLEGTDYKLALQAFWHLNPSAEIIVMSPPEIIREAVMVVKAGASNYLTYPINSDEVKYLTESIYESLIFQSELDYLRDQFWQSDSLEIVKTKNPLMKKVFDKIRSVAPTKSTVLLSGETGTGKGVLAQLLHKHSNRKDAPFINVHCGAMPDSLLESELFGHEKGAFTGAVRRKLGKFEIAKGGTIFLDEIATITPSAQIKLLQILQEGTFGRVGGEETIEANVRIIAATNTFLKTMCEAGQFRNDLFFRLNVFPIDIPPLRERREDIPFFVEVILTKLNKFHSKNIRSIHPQVLEAFNQYPWPGNIRELENLMERAYILETSPMLKPESFPSEIFVYHDSPQLIFVNSSLTLAETRRRGIEYFEKQYLKEILTQNNGRIKESAATAGITTRQLNKLMTRYGIKKEEFKVKAPIIN